MIHKIDPLSNLLYNVTYFYRAYTYIVIIVQKLFIIIIIFIFISIKNYEQSINNISKEMAIQERKNIL